MQIEQHFSGSYFEARAKFLDACRARGLAVKSHENTNGKGPRDERLFSDVARLGPDRPSRLVVVSSATHGVEGFAGSGPQVALLKTDFELPRDVGLMLVHAVNPHGFAHERRVTDENVDLNRNFIDFDGPPENDGYAELHPFFVPKTYRGRDKENADCAIQNFIATKGIETFQAVVQRGQYTDPDGLFYGGTAPTWSHQMLRQLVADEMSAIERLAVVDIHTGLGERGVGEAILDGDPDGREAERARNWYGEVTCPGRKESVSAEITGTSSAVYAEAGCSELTRITLEFGTVELITVFEAVRADNWLYARGGGNTESESGREIKARIRQAFYGEDAEWKRAIWNRTYDIVRKAIEGLR